MGHHDHRKPVFIAFSDFLQQEGYKLFHSFFPGQVCFHGREIAWVTVRYGDNVADGAAVPHDGEDMAFEKLPVKFVAVFSLEDVAFYGCHDGYSHEVPQRVGDLYLVAVVVAGCHDDLH